MDSTFLNGSAAFASAMLVFVGSVWLLLALVMGARLAYLITATVTLAFVLMMGLVWSYGTPLGPVGELPTWNAVDIGTDAASLGFGPAAEYPGGGWQVPEEGDAAAADLESSAPDRLAEAIDDGTIDAFESEGDATVEADSSRLLEQDGDLYGAVTMVGLEGTEFEGNTPVIVIQKYDPGNPSGPARMITAGTFIVLVGHLIALSRMEQSAARKRKEEETQDA